MNKNKQTQRGKEKISWRKVNEIGENTFLKLRKEKDQLKEQLDQVKIQRDIALRKLNKALQISKDLRKIIENGQTQ